MIVCSTPRGSDAALQPVVWLNRPCPRTSHDTSSLPLRAQSFLIPNLSTGIRRATSADGLRTLLQPYNHTAQTIH